MLVRALMEDVCQTRAPAWPPLVCRAPSTSRTGGHGHCSAVGVHDMGNEEDKGTHLMQWLAARSTRLRSSTACTRAMALYVSAGIGGATVSTRGDALHGVAQRSCV